MCIGIRLLELLGLLGLFEPSSHLGGPTLAKVSAHESRPVLKWLGLSRLLGLLGFLGCRNNR